MLVSVLEIGIKRREINSYGFYCFRLVREIINYINEYLVIDFIRVLKEIIIVL